MTTDTKIYSPKKLIEVTLPLDEINAACVREKSIRHGHPSTLHPWWARRPLAAARAVIFASMVNDPGYINKDFRHGVNKEEAQKRREELCDLIKELVKWENLNNTNLLARANQLMQESWREICSYNKNHPQAKELFNPENPPAFHDPFAGGGALPLEAQRLGMDAYASDLNPVAVLINKAVLEIPKNFQGIPPCGPLPTGETGTLNHNNSGLAEDIRRYGYWVYEKAKEKIGHLYPQIQITSEIASTKPELQGFIGHKFPVIGWIWARTVKSPNPIYSDIYVPLIATFSLSNKSGNEYYIQPITNGKSYDFQIIRGKCPNSLINGTKSGARGNFSCLLSGTPITSKYIKEQGKLNLIKNRLLAIIIKTKNGRDFIAPNQTTNELQLSIPDWIPNTRLAHDPRNLKTPLYGLERFRDLFSDRQLVALATFSSIISGNEPWSLSNQIKQDAIKSGLPDDDIPLSSGGKGVRGYAEAIELYLSFAIDKCADYWSSTCTWSNSRDTIRNTFGRQAISMTWDYCEANPFSNATGSWLSMVEWISKAVSFLPSMGTGHVFQAAAQTQNISFNKVVSTDPPYYDNISYANLSDFFYICSG